MLKALAKAVTWRLLGAADTFVVCAVTTWIATGRPDLTVATGVVGFEVLTKTLLYVAHERAWEKLGGKLAAAGAAA